MTDGPIGDGSDAANVAPDLHPGNQSRPTAESSTPNVTTATELKQTSELRSDPAQVKTPVSFAAKVPEPQAKLVEGLVKKTSSAESETENQQSGAEAQGTWQYTDNDNIAFSRDNFYGDLLGGGPSFGNLGGWFSKGYYSVSLGAAKIAKMLGLDQLSFGVGWWGGGIKPGLDATVVDSTTGVSTRHSVAYSGSGGVTIVDHGPVEKESKDDYKRGYKASERKHKVTIHRSMDVGLDYKAAVTSPGDQGTSVGRGRAGTSSGDSITKIMTVAEINRLKREKGKLAASLRRNLARCLPCFITSKLPTLDSLEISQDPKENLRSLKVGEGFSITRGMHFWALGGLPAFGGFPILNPIAALGGSFQRKITIDRIEPPSESEQSEDSGAGLSPPEASTASGQWVRITISPATGSVQRIGLSSKVGLQAGCSHSSHTGDDIVFDVNIAHDKSKEALESFLANLTSLKKTLWHKIKSYLPKWLSPSKGRPKASLESFFKAEQTEDDNGDEPRQAALRPELDHAADIARKALKSTPKVHDDLQSNVIFRRNMSTTAGRWGGDCSFNPLGAKMCGASMGVASHSGVIHNDKVAFTMIAGHSKNSSNTIPRDGTAKNRVSFHQVLKWEPTQGSDSTGFKVEPAFVEARMVYEESDTKEQSKEGRKRIGRLNKLIGANLRQDPSPLTSNNASRRYAFELKFGTADLYMMNSLLPNIKALGSEIRRELEFTSGSAFTDLIKNPSKLYDAALGAYLRFKLAEKGGAIKEELKDLCDRLLAVKTAVFSDPGDFRQAYDLIMSLQDCTYETSHTSANKRLVRKKVGNKKDFFFICYDWSRVLSKFVGDQRDLERFGIVYRIQRAAINMVEESMASPGKRYSIQTNDVEITTYHGAFDDVVRRAKKHLTSFPADIFPGMQRGVEEEGAEEDGGPQSLVSRFWKAIAKIWYLGETDFSFARRMVRKLTQDLEALARTEDVLYHDQTLGEEAKKQRMSELRTLARQIRLRLSPQNDPKFAHSKPATVWRQFAGNILKWRTRARLIPGERSLQHFENFLSLPHELSTPVPQICTDVSQLRGKQDSGFDLYKQCLELGEKLKKDRENGMGMKNASERKQSEKLKKLYQKKSLQLEEFFASLHNNPLLTPIMQLQVRKLSRMCKHALETGDTNYSDSPMNQVSQVEPSNEDAANPIPSTGVAKASSKPRTLDFKFDINASDSRFLLGSDSINHGVTQFNKSAHSAGVEGLQLPYSGPAASKIRHRLEVSLKVPGIAFDNLAFLGHFIAVFQDQFLVEGKKRSQTLPSEIREGTPPHRVLESIHELQKQCRNYNPTAAHDRIKDSRRWLHLLSHTIIRLESLAAEDDGVERSESEKLEKQEILAKLRRLELFVREISDVAFANQIEFQELLELVVKMGDGQFSQVTRCNQLKEWVQTSPARLKGQPAAQKLAKIRRFGALKKLLEVMPKYFPDLPAADAKVEMSYQLKAVASQKGDEGYFDERIDQLTLAVNNIETNWSLPLVDVPADQLLRKAQPILELLDKCRHLMTQIAGAHLAQRKDSDLERNVELGQEVIKLERKLQVKFGEMVRKLAEVQLKPIIKMSRTSKFNRSMDLVWEAAHYHRTGRRPSSENFLVYSSVGKLFDQPDTDNPAPLQSSPLPKWLIMDNQELLLRSIQQAQSRDPLNMALGAMAVIR